MKLETSPSVAPRTIPEAVRTVGPGAAAAAAGAGLSAGFCGAACWADRGVATKSAKAEPAFASGYRLRRRVKESEPSFEAPPCCAYTSVTTKGLVTWLPDHGEQLDPVQQDRRRADDLTDTSWMSTFL